MSFTLLTIPDVSVSSSSFSERGKLSLECTSSDSGGTPLPGSDSSSVVLDLHINSRLIKLEPSSAIQLVISHTGERRYTFEEPASEKSDGKPRAVALTIPQPTEEVPHVAEDIETFDQLLTQYAELSWSYSSPASGTAPPPLPARTIPSAPHTNLKSNVEEQKPVEDPSLRGRLVLMDDANGEVVGELPQSLHITEDPVLPTLEKAEAGAHETTPVVLEMHPDMYDACTGVRALGAEGEDVLEIREVFVRAIPPEEQDWYIKGATLVSQAISSSTSVLLSGITFASNFYISHSRPGTPANPDSGASSPKPPSPPSSHPALAKAHALSGQAARASAKTADIVENAIRRAMGGKPKTSTSNSPSTSASSSAIATPIIGANDPPPPYAVYTPKHRPRPSRQYTDSKVADPELKEEEPPKPLGTKDKLLLSANLVLTTVDDSARRVFEVSTDRLGAVVGHKYGADAQHSTHLATHTARNIVLVYVDMKGFARRALITKAGKEFVKARVGGRGAPRREVVSPAPVKA